MNEWKIDFKMPYCKKTPAFNYFLWSIWTYYHQKYRKPDKPEEEQCNWSDGSKIFDRINRNRLIRNPPIVKDRKSEGTERLDLLNRISLYIAISLVVNLFPISLSTLGVLAVVMTLNLVSCLFFPWLYIYLVIFECAFYFITNKTSCHWF